MKKRKGVKVTGKNINAMLRKAKGVLYTPQEVQDDSHTFFLYVIGRFATKSTSNVRSIEDTVCGEYAINQMLQFRRDYELHVKSL